MSWIVYAGISALAAALTAVLAKAGVEGVPSNLATAVRTGVVMVLSSAIVIGTKQHHALSEISRRSLIFLVLSGLATGVSWLAYFKALQLGAVSKVSAVDKLSLPLTLVLAALLLGEPMGWRVATGLAVMAVGAIIAVG
jgi:transporter family protein